MTRRLWQLHSWLGLAGGLILLVIGLSGSVLVFRHELEAWLFPAAHRIQPPANAKIDYDRLHETVRARWPDAWDVRFRRLPLTSSDPVQFALSRHSKRMRDDWFHVYVNPYTAEILKVQHALGKYGARENPLDWLLWLHSTLLAGTVGTVIVGLSSLVLLASSVTGLWIYRHRIGRGLLLNLSWRKASWRKRWSEIHGVVGVWTAVLNLIFALTGFWMTRYIYTADLYASAPVPLGTPTPAPAVPYNQVLARVAAEFPTFQSTGISGIEATADDYKIFGRRHGQSALFGNHASRLEIIGTTGTVRAKAFIDEQPWPTRLEAMVTPIHFGQFGGWPIKILWCLGGLAPAVLALSGTAVWWSRRRVTAN